MVCPLVYSVGNQWGMFIYRLLVTGYRDNGSVKMDSLVEFENDLYSESTESLLL